jgi:hypothetical protein
MLLRRLVCVLFLLLVGGAPVVAAPDETATIKIEPFFEGSFRPGQWLPVRVAVANSGPDRRAVIRLGDDTGGTYDTSVELPGGSRKELVMYMRPESFARTVKARLIDGKQELARAEAKAKSLPARAEVIGVLTDFPLAAPQPDTPSNQIPLSMIYVRQSDFPSRVEGLLSFDVLVAGSAQLTQLGREQLVALDDWIRGGGQLVVSPGEKGLMIEALPATLRIATAGPTADQAVVGTVLADLGEGATVRAAPLTPVEGATALDALVVQQEQGRGRVTLLGFSLDDPALGKLPRENRLWPALITMRRFDPNFPPGMNPEDMQAQQLTQALFNLPALDLPPLGVLAGLLLAYIILVGPVLYLILWRRDRQAWAWIAIPALTLLFSAVAYGYGLRIRGNDVILNQIAIVQPAGDRARVRTFAGIFSPATRGYDVSVGGDALTRPLPFDARSWGRATGPPAVSGHYTQGGGITDLQVDQWTMSTFGVEGVVPFGPINAQIELGDGRLAGVVHNGGTVVLRDVALIQGGRVARIGDLGPGAKKPVELLIDDGANPNGQPISMSIFKDRWDQQNGPPPVALRVPIQVVDSLYNFTPWSTNTSPVVIGWLDNNPLPARITEGRIQYQQTTLVEVPVRLSYGQTVTFPRSWTRADYESPNIDQGGCMTQWGPGAMLMSSDTITATLQLPAAAQRLRVTKASLFTQFEGPPPDRALLEAYDWSAGTWTGQSETLGTSELSDPQRFVRNRELRVRVKIPGAMMKGCVTVGATVGGTR